VIDESFHLTPLDVRRTEFPAALRGYDRARVDEFRDRVAHELERLTRLNHELENKAKGFHEQLRAFRERDKALNEALVSAQQLRAETRAQAEREAGLALREARAEGERLIDAAKAEARRLSSEIESLERSRRAYLAQLRALVARQLAELDAIPSQDASRPDGLGAALPAPVPSAPVPSAPAPAAVASATPATTPPSPSAPHAAASAPTSAAPASSAPAGGEGERVPRVSGGALAGAGSVAPRTTTVPLAAVPGDDARRNGDVSEVGKDAGEKEKGAGDRTTGEQASGEQDAGSRPAVQTPVWLKAVPSKE
jgi:cell division initiation protein